MNEQTILSFKRKPSTCFHRTSCNIVSTVSVRGLYLNMHRHL